MKAVIFNSGIGSRMGQLTQNKPKCMLQLYNGETILERQIRIISDFGIKDFIITTGPHKNQLLEIAQKYKSLNFTFVENKEYKNTNYIVSMNNINEYLDEDILLLHGDLVFNKELIKKVLNHPKKSICLYNEQKELPKKDFKGRIINNILQEVSISIFDNNCYAFQPLYKLSKEDIIKWKNKVAEFVNNGNKNVYAEEALNEITNEIKIYGISYKDDYIEEIDTLEDYNKVSNEIKYFDYKEQNIQLTTNYIDCLKKYITKDENIFIVSSKSFLSRIKNDLKDYKITIFSDYTKNPKYEDIKKGIKLFKSNNYKKIISIGGGSTIDVAKCIKLFHDLNETSILESNFSYNNIEHITIPTTAGTGSESTAIAVMYYNGEKKSIYHESILPTIAILDYTVLTTLPDYQKKSTLLDALSQAIESFWAKGATDTSKYYASKSIKLILDNYKQYLENDALAAKNMMLAANYSGKAINISRTTAPHAMSYKLSSLYDISHGHAVGICLIPCWNLLLKKSQYNKELHKTLKELSKIISDDKISTSINYISKLIKSLNLPSIKINDKDLDILVNSINIERLNNNPVLFTKEELKNLYSTINKEINQYN